ncbi:fimbrial protein [Pseudomonas chlororaphis]|uniref:fimbrial protein n=1 Tax=Pseudomonas chlororaphis TaxID=587753 RepID=UPI001B315AD9|nr:fimbrial protein [Pseudomonas chlororaphis]QTT88608.1 fimbrial protein [Pseudomonas chlororaphis]
MPTQNVGKFFDFRARVAAPVWTIEPDNGQGVNVAVGASRRCSSGMAQVVELGVLSLEALQAGGSFPQLFSIELNEDRLKDAKKVQVYFDGITSDGVILMNDYEEAGSARNVGVQLLDSEGKVLLLGHVGCVEYPAAPGFRLSFAARLVSTSGPVEAGEFSSFAECVILYA